MDGRHIKQRMLLIVTGAVYCTQLIRDFVLLTIELAMVGLGSHLDQSSSRVQVLFLCGMIPKCVNVDQTLKGDGQIN